jgi:hypothetical protein
MLRQTLVLALVLALLVSTGYAKGRQVDFLLPAVSDLGGVIGSGHVHTYTAGTTTPKSIYSDAALTEVLDNPADLDTDGRLVAYGTGLYKFTIHDSAGNLVFTVDDVDLTSVYDFSTDSSNPFGTTLTQTTIIASSATIVQETVASLTVTGFINVLGTSTWTAASIASLTATMGADLNANTHKITDLATGTANGDAVNFGQLSAFGADLAGSQLFSSTGAQNFTVPTGTARIWVTCVGGGGGGGGAASATTSSGGGGGSGASVYRFEVTSSTVVLPGVLWTVTVGAGGAGGGAGSLGTTGGTTSVFYGATNIVSCVGGSGGGSGLDDNGAAGAAGTATVLGSAANISGGSPGGLGRHYVLSATLHAARSPQGGSNIFGQGGAAYDFLYDPASYPTGIYSTGAAGAGKGSGGGGGVGYAYGASGGAGANGFVLLEW